MLTLLRRPLAGYLILLLTYIIYVCRLCMMIAELMVHAVKLHGDQSMV